MDCTLAGDLGDLLVDNPLARRAASGHDGGEP